MNNENICQVYACIDSMKDEIAEPITGTEYLKTLNGFNFIRVHRLNMPSMEFATDGSVQFAQDLVAEMNRRASEKA